LLEAIGGVEGALNLIVMIVYSTYASFSYRNSLLASVLDYKTEKDDRE
jgi:hypothetical protein